MLTPDQENPYRAEICNICGSSLYSIAYHFDRWSCGKAVFENIRVIRCRCCGVRRRMPALVDEYEKDYHAPYVDQGASIHPHMLSFFADLMTARIRKFNEKGVKFLDVGVSTGRAMALAQAMGFDCRGFDVSKWAVEYVKSKGFEADYSPSIHGIYAAEMFDVVHCSHVIEHVPDPLFFCGSCIVFLKMAGI